MGWVPLQVKSHVWLKLPNQGVAVMLMDLLAHSALGVKSGCCCHADGFVSSLSFECYVIFIDPDFNPACVWKLCQIVQLKLGQFMQKKVKMATESGLKAFHSSVRDWTIGQEKKKEKKTGTIIYGKWPTVYRHVALHKIIAEVLLFVS